MSQENETIEIGYRNKNGQAVKEATGRSGSDRLQQVYMLRCGHCSTFYGANGSDIWQRKCPCCQGGEPGLAV